MQVGDTLVCLLELPADEPAPGEFHYADPLL